MIGQPSTWVYVLAPKRGRVKIGSSCDPERRASELRYMASGKLEVVVRHYRPDDAPHVEWLAHWLLREKRTEHLEWYSIPVAEAEAAIVRAIEIFDTNDFAAIPRTKLPASMRWRKPGRYIDLLAPDEMARFDLEMEALNDTDV